MKKLTSFQSALIWFGAGVSIAEILTGTYFAPLGFAKGLAAILTGHVIGCAMMFLAGIIGGRTRRSAMETTKMSFGKRGGVFFARRGRDKKSVRRKLPRVTFRVFSLVPCDRRSDPFMDCSRHYKSRHYQ